MITAKNICRKYTNYVTEQKRPAFKKICRQKRSGNSGNRIWKDGDGIPHAEANDGDDLFYKSLRRFYKDKIWQRAGWKDIQHIFEENCKTDLSWFFGSGSTE